LRSVKQVRTWVDPGVIGDLPLVGFKVAVSGGSTLTISLIRLVSACFPLLVTRHW